MVKTNILVLVAFCAVFGVELIQARDFIGDVTDQYHLPLESAYGMKGKTKESLGAHNGENTVYIRFGDKSQCDSGSVIGQWSDALIYNTPVESFIDPVDFKLATPFHGYITNGKVIYAEISIGGKFDSADGNLLVRDDEENGKIVTYFNYILRGTKVSEFRYTITVYGDGTPAELVSDEYN